MVWKICKPSVTAGALERRSNLPRAALTCPRRGFRYRWHEAVRGGKSSVDKATVLIGNGRNELPGIVGEVGSQRALRAVTQNHRAGIVDRDSAYPGDIEQVRAKLQWPTDRAAVRHEPAIVNEQPDGLVP